MSSTAHFGSFLSSFASGRVPAKRSMCAPNFLAGAIFSSSVQGWDLSAHDGSGSGCGTSPQRTGPSGTR